MFLVLQSFKISFYQDFSFIISFHWEMAVGFWQVVVRTCHYQVLIRMICWQKIRNVVEGKLLFFSFQPSPTSEFTCKLWIKLPIIFFSHSSLWHQICRLSLQHKNQSTKCSDENYLILSKLWPLLHDSWWFNNADNYLVIMMFSFME